MTLLIDIQDQNWLSNEQFREALPSLGEQQICFYPDITDASSIRMLACDRLRPGLAERLPALELVQKLGAGVETMVNDPQLPAHVRITRLKTETTALEMARYCAAFVLRDLHNLAFHEHHQKLSSWTPMAPRAAATTPIGVLGLGHIGSTVADLFVSMGFEVCGWSRSAKTLANVSCLYGDDGLGKVLGESDFVISVLPSTQATSGLFDYNRFAQMRPGSCFINVGRGSLVVEQDLIKALDNDCLRHAVLDVFQVEPLPEESPLWLHPGVSITPHVSGWDLGTDMSVVEQNYLRLVAGTELLHEINRGAGY